MVPVWSASGSFAAVIAVQFLWFFLVALGRVSVGRALRHLAVGGAAGIPLGLFFDLAIGKYASLFHYANFPTTGGFMLVNGIFSYGLAIATVLSLQAEELPPWPGGRKGIALLAASLAFSLALLMPVDQMPPLAGMFLLGALVLLFTEALGLASGRMGYMAQAWRGRFRPATRIWLFSVVTGLVYETANHAFGLWVWENRFPTPAVNLLLIVLLGYFVLLLPIFTFSAVLSGLNQLARGK